jgi:hypothetical protein
MTRQAGVKHRKLVVIGDGAGEVGYIVSETDGESSGLCKYFRITADGWKVLEEWLETSHPSYKVRVQ